MQDERVGPRTAGLLQGSVTLRGGQEAGVSRESQDEALGGPAGPGSP